MHGFIDAMNNALMHIILHTVLKFNLRGRKVFKLWVCSPDARLDYCQIKRSRSSVRGYATGNIYTGGPGSPDYRKSTIKNVGIDVFHPFDSLLGF
jgi:hypothetical protein